MLMFWFHLTLKLLEIACIGIAVSFVILWVAFICVRTLILFRKVSRESSDNGGKAKKRSHIANYSYTINYCINRGFYLKELFGILYTGRYKPSIEIDDLSHHHEYGHDEDAYNGIIRMIYSPFPKVFSKPIRKVIQCFHLMRLYHKRKSESTKNERNRKLVPETERDLVNILAGMRRGEALVLGEAAPMPTRVQIDMPSPTPRSNDVDFYKHWIQGPEDLDVAAIVDRWRRQTR